MENNELINARSLRLRYMDTSLRPRIAYQIRIRHGYASDTPPIRILRVSIFFIFVNIGYMTWIRICLADTPSPALSSDPDARCRKPVPRAASPFPAQ